MSRGLAIALSLSAATHLAAAVVMLTPTTPISIAGDRVISIQLVQPAIATVTEPLPAPEPAAVPRREARNPPPQTPSVTRTPPPQMASVTPVPSPQPAPTQKTEAEPAPLTASQAVDSSAASDTLRQHVGQLLSKHFHYPRLARSRGWEGIVELGLHIAADGRVSNIILHRRSAYPTLDRAALVAAGQLRSVPGAAALLDQDGLELVVPVHYRLIDS